MLLHSDQQPEAIVDRMFDRLEYQVIGASGRANIVGMTTQPEASHPFYFCGSSPAIIGEPRLGRRPHRRYDCFDFGMSVEGIEPILRRLHRHFGMSRTRVALENVEFQFGSYRHHLHLIFNPNQQMLVLPDELGYICLCELCKEHSDKMMEGAIDRYLGSPGIQLIETEVFGYKTKAFAV